MKVLITGAGGFVGRHLVAALAQSEPGADIILTGRRGALDPHLGEIAELDVTDATAVGDAIARFAPDRVVHLAGLAAPAEAARDRDAAWRINLGGTLTVARAILTWAPACGLLFAGSGHVYGGSAASGEPMTEDTPLAPLDDYAASKAAADLALNALAGEGLRCLRFRPFNHIGPGQREAFVLPAFGLQIARIEAGLGPAVLKVGNLDAERDFLDARDVAVAYARGIGALDRLPAGLVLNLASGVPRRIGDLLNRMLASSRVPIEIETDRERLRPADIPRIVGDAARAREALGWSPEHAIEDTISDILDDCRRRVDGGNA